MISERALAEKMEVSKENNILISGASDLTEQAEVWRNRIEVSVDTGKREVRYASHSGIVHWGRAHRGCIFSGRPIDLHHRSSR